MQCPVVGPVTCGLQRTCPSQHSSSGHSMHCMVGAQGVSHFKDVRYTDTVSYGELFMQNEYEMGRYNLDLADVDTQRKRFDLYNAVCTSGRKGPFFPLPPPPPSPTSLCLQYLCHRGHAGLHRTQIRFVCGDCSLPGTIVQVWLTPEMENLPRLRGIALQPGCNQNPIYVEYLEAYVA